MRHAEPAAKINGLYQNIRQQQKLNICIRLIFVVLDDCTLTLWMCVSIFKDVGITLHTCLTSGLAGSNNEVTLVTNKYTETKIPHCSTEEIYQLHASTTSTPWDIFLNPLQNIRGRWTTEQISSLLMTILTSLQRTKFFHICKAATDPTLSKTWTKLSVSLTQF